MSTSFPHELQKLRDGIIKYNQLEDQINALSTTLDILAKEIATSKQALKKESKDVEQLNSKSLQSIYHKIRGNYDSQLEKEMQEQQQAKLQLDLKIQELEHLQLEIQNLRNAKLTYHDCQQNYNRLYKEKLNELLSDTSSDVKAKESLLGLQKDIEHSTNKLNELNEAVRAGKRVQTSLNQALNHLKSASSWGTFDIFGGGLITDMAKHSKIDDARQALSKAQRDLRDFRSELADVSMNISISIDIGSFTKFADYFFDDIFSSISVKSKITDAQNNVTNAIKKVQSTLITLEQTILKTKDDIDSANAKIEEIVVNSN